MIDSSINKNAERLELLLKTLPETPGVYQYFDEEGKILYVGKAKNVKKRVSSYFRQEQLLSSKIKMLVRKIYDIKYIIVNTEFDALLLENNLIKKLQPRYNSMLKDDKTYPWMCITNEPFPRMFQTRKRIPNGSTYFGPYPSLRVLRELQELIRKVFRYRICTQSLTEENIRRGKFKACISYQIKQCNAPCVGNETREEYQQTISQIKKILKGDFSDMLQTLKKQMMLHVQKLEFEKAQEIKERLMLLEQYQSRSMVVSNIVKDVDVYSIISDEKSAYINMMRIKNGSIIYSYNTEVQKKLDEPDEEILAFAIYELHERVESTAREIVVPFKLNLPNSYLQQTIPLQGDRRKLLDLSEQNIKFYRLEKLKQSTLLDPERNVKRVLQTLQKDLKMSVLPERIECFDNSNTQGSFPVAAMVCFINGKPANKEYRHFNIKTVEGPNDFASMEEIIYRRYKRLLEEEKPLPQLIVVDGGKGQLSSAVKVLQQLDLYGKVAIIGIAERLEEIYFPGDNIPLYLDKKSESQRIIQHIRDEAHRFGITHHRKKRIKGTIFTSLTDIKGIGDTAARDLLLKFASVKNVKKATLEELTTCIGKAKAKLVYDYFHTQEGI